MKKAVNIYLDIALHKVVRKRIIDVDMNLSEYLALLIQHELDSDIIESLKNQRCESTDSVA